MLDLLRWLEPPFADVSRFGYQLELVAAAERLAVAGLTQHGHLDSPGQGQLKRDRQRPGALPEDGSGLRADAQRRVLPDAAYAAVDIKLTAAFFAGLAFEAVAVQIRAGVSSSSPLKPSTLATVAKAHLSGRFTVKFVSS